MMIPERPSLERRVLSALDGSTGGGQRIPVVLGGCGTGRSSLLLRLRDLIGRNACQFVDVERIATTPERMLQAIRDVSPFPIAGGTGRTEVTARAAFDGMLNFFGVARAAGDAPATFLLDEFLELRTFESFPGLRSVLRDLLAALAASPNRFVLTSRYTARALRLLRDAPAQFEIVHVAPLTAAEIRATLPAGHDADDAATPMHEAEDDRARDELARLVQGLSEGKPAYARMLTETAAAMATRGAADPVSALAALLAPGGALTLHCRYSLRAAPAPRPRLRRAQGHPRGSRRRRAADADGDRAAPAAHARLDQGLPVVARGRGPDRLAPEALQLRRPDDAVVGAAALPPGAALGRGRRARSASLRDEPAARRRARDRARARRSARGRRRARQVLGNYRNRLTQGSGLRTQGLHGSGLLVLSCALSPQP